MSKSRKSKASGEVALVEDLLDTIVKTNLKRWWEGKITGAKCVKNITDSGIETGARVAGGIAGGQAGMGFGIMLAGPTGGAIGAMVGAVVGSLTASSAAELLAGGLTEWFFGLSQEGALENAYRFMGMNPLSSNSEINARFKKLESEYHSEKDKEKWTRVQYSLAVIREARKAN